MLAVSDRFYSGQARDFFLSAISRNVTCLSSLSYFGATPRYFDRRKVIGLKIQLDM